MADDLETPESDVEPTAVEAPPEKRRRRRRLNLGDPDDLVTETLEAIEAAQHERAEWIKKRVFRYAKLRGWLESKDWPWQDASNAHVPVMMANCLRVKAGLFNAVMGIRPIMTPKTLSRTQKDAAEQANQLIDYQMFVENEGERIADTIIDSFVHDGTFVTHQKWVKRDQTLHDVRVLPRPDGDLVAAMADLITTVLMPGATEVVAHDPDGFSWSAVVADADGTKRDVYLDVFDHADDDKIECVLEWEATVFDGPNVTPHDLEDVVVPMRSENTQPVSPENSFGAPWVARMIRVPLDHVRRMQENGTYDHLTKSDLEMIGAVSISRTDSDSGTGTNEQELKFQKDELAGLQAGNEDTLDEWITVIEWYGPRPIGSGPAEEVILTILKEPKLLARARFLTEIYPGLPVQRPFADERFIPVPGEFYGIGLPELMEGMHDLLHVLFNQNIDHGTLANVPFGFYRPSSGSIKPDRMSIEPGVLIPSDNPQQDVFFPQLPHADQSWSFNMIGLAMQFLERLVQQGALQFGQVPQGKASALRTASTTFAILQQGAALPEQILRRLFAGLARIWHQVHQMNAKYLPKNKRYLVVGKPLDQQDAYGVVSDPETLAVPIQFDFQATLLNTNKGLVSQALTSLGSALVNPLMLQSGLVKPEQIYNWAKDLIQAYQLDPARYLVRPPDMPEGGNRWLFEEVLQIILSDRLPEVAPLEPVEEHYQKALKFLASDQVGMLSPPQAALLREYLRGVTMLLRQRMQQQQMMQAAAQFATSIQQGGQGTTAQIGAPPDVQTETPLTSEIVGAEGRAG